MQAASAGDKQALSQAALELLRQLTRMQEHAKVQSQSPAEGLEPLPLEPPHLQELLADLSGKGFATPPAPSLSLAQCLLIMDVLNSCEAVRKPKPGMRTGFRSQHAKHCSAHPDTASWQLFKSCFLPPVGTHQRPRWLLIWP